MPEITKNFILTSFEVPGYRIVRSLGIVHGGCVTLTFF